MPASLYQSRNRNEVITVIGMLEHEQKMSVINMVLKRCQNTPWADIPIKSKEEIIFQCGYRRFKARPIFSQHCTGNKHKVSRINNLRLLLGLLQLNGFLVANKKCFCFVVVRKIFST